MHPARSPAARRTPVLPDRGSCDGLRREQAGPKGQPLISYAHHMICRVITITRSQFTQGAPLPFLPPSASASLPSLELKVHIRPFVSASVRPSVRPSVRLRPHRSQRGDPTSTSTHTRTHDISPARRQASASTGPRTRASASASATVGCVVVLVTHERGSGGARRGTGERQRCPLHLSTSGRQVGDTPTLSVRADPSCLHSVDPNLALVHHRMF